MTTDPDIFGTTLEIVQVNVGDLMTRILRHFKPDAKITVVVRRPGLPDQDFVMTNDDLTEAIACLARRRDTSPVQK